MRGLLAAAVAALVALPAGQTPDAGSISGHVRLTRVRGTPLRSNVYQPRAVQRHDAGAAPEIRNVVVYLKNVAFKGTLPVSRQEIRQEAESFSPRVVAITRGSTVDFPNGDPFFHDVFSLSRSGTFDLGSYPKGQVKSHQFRQAGLVKVYCHIHSHMSASIMVFDHSLFTIPRADGSFTIDDVPTGTYQVSAWHERIGENSQPVKIEAGKASEVRFSLPIGIK